jgi:stage V sporulation protein AB
MNWIHSLFMMFVGLAGGMAVGGGLVAFLTVLDVIPRLARIIRMREGVRLFENAVIVGAIFWTIIDFFNVNIHLSLSAPAVLGILSGVFVGMLAGALTEVLNVIPIMAKRLGMKEYILWLLMAMILGKVIGSIIHWTLF